MKTRIMAGMILGVALSGFAGERFGGIGVAFHSAENGVRVVDVIQGSLADAAGLEPGDCILRVDENPLAGMTTKDAAAILRDAAGTTLSLRVLRADDTLSVRLRRASLEVKTLHPSGRDSSSRERLLLKASDEASHGYALLDVVDLPESASGVFVATEVGDASAESVVRSGGSSGSTAVLRSFSREHLGFRLTESGAVDVQIRNLRGAALVSLHLLEGRSGENELFWNGRGLPAGTYILQLEQNGKSSRFLGSLP